MPKVKRYPTPIERLNRVYSSAKFCVFNFAYWLTIRKILLEVTDVNMVYARNELANGYLSDALFEWCVLMIENEPHAWNYYIPEGVRDQFMPELLAQLSLDASAWKTFVDDIRQERDRLKATRDKFEMATSPDIDRAVAAVAFYIAYLDKHHPRAKSVPNYNVDIARHFQESLKLGAQVFSK